MNENSELCKFMRKHDACDFGFRLLDAKGCSTLREAWEQGEMASLIFLYVKGVKSAEGSVLFDLASRFAAHCAEQGKLDAAETILEFRAKALANLSTHLRLTRQMLELITMPERKYNNEKTVRGVSLSAGRNCTYFAFDYAMQALCGGYNIRFSYRMARIFREMVGANPFEQPQASGTSVANQTPDGTNR